MKTILWGICGIGAGHCNRQLPLIQHYQKLGYKIIIFTYGTGISFFNNNLKNTQIIAVANPYYVGDLTGLNFELTAKHPLNQINFESINALALETIKNNEIVLVISDYEMVSAKYSYLKNIPLITIDQQSKFLIGDFPQVLNNTSYIDEIERLSLFFPKAEKRIAVSFFKVEKKLNSQFNVDIVAPQINLPIIKNKEIKNSILVYVSGQIKSEININEWINVLKDHKDFIFHIFIPELKIKHIYNNIKIYKHNDPQYFKIFEQSTGIISTAGHSLISEAMFYHKPVYAIPINLYEQQINAYKIQEGNFGVMDTALNENTLNKFLSNINKYKDNIINDTKILLKTNNKKIYKIIDSALNKD